MLQSNSILKRIGNTPLATIDLGIKPKIFAKLEYLNPSGSIKDRPALFMIELAEKQGLLKPGGTLIEASSGNQGIALAMIGAVKSYKVIITIPDGTSTEKINLLKSYGAEIYAYPPTPTLAHPESFRSKAQLLAQEIPNAFYSNQFANKANPLAHYTTTGPEIWQQTNGTITHFFAGKGTNGTITGAGKYLKEQNPHIKIIAVDESPASVAARTHRIEGIGYPENKDTFDLSVIDETILVEGNDAFAMSKKLTREQGLSVGLSSGAIASAIMQYAHKLKSSDLVVAIFADSGRAYLSKLFKD